MAQALAARPRYIVVANRQMNFACATDANWQLVDDVLKQSYRLLVRSEGIIDNYAVYEFIAGSQK